MNDTMNDTEVAKAILDKDTDRILWHIMQEILDGTCKIASPSVGICNAIRRAGESLGLDCKEIYHLDIKFSEMATHWAEYSGDYRFPVPNTRKGSSPCSQYIRSKSLWSKRTKYGRLRWELVQFTQDCLAKEIKAKQKPVYDNEHF